MGNSRFGCAAGHVIKLRSGNYLDLVNPKPEQFTLFDISCALSKICRFGGQIRDFYSVAEHCYHCAKIAKKDGLPKSIQAAALLHDASESFLGDCVKPLKLLLPDYVKLEHHMESVIAEKYGVDFSPKEIKKIDMEMLIAERRAMFPKDTVKWIGEDGVRKINVRFRKWDHVTAESSFTWLANHLGITE